VSEVPASNYSKRRAVTAYGLSAAVDEISGLFAALEQKHAHRSSAQAEADELRLTARTYDPQSHVLTARLNGHPVGAVLLLVQGDVVYVRSAGLDYDVVGDAFEYFNLAY